MNFKKMTFLCMQKLTNFPYIEADFDALTNYELLCKVVEYLNKIIANENLQNDAINELATAFNNLKDFVDNYFDNLDVQEEINNKLDEMAESGELTDIIAQYLGLAGMIAYDTVADMKLAENLVNGSKCRTLGFYSVNDGGGSYYKVRTITNDDVVDEMTIIALYDNTLIAELIYDNEIVLNQLGAKDEANFNCSPMFTKAFSLPINKIKLLSGRYRISAKLSIPAGFTIEGVENQYNYTEITLTSSDTCVIETEFRNITLDNLLITKSGEFTCYGINSGLFNNEHYNLTIKRCRLSGFTTAIRLSGSIWWESSIEDTRVSLSTVGFQITNCFDLILKQFYTDRCTTVMNLYGNNTITFYNCNFGVINYGIEVLFGNDGMKMNLAFIGCNFEYDETLESADGGFIRVATNRNSDCDITMINNRFTINGQNANVKSLAFNRHTTISFLNNLYLPNSETDNPTSFFNSSLPPKREIGCLKFLGGNSSMPRPSYSGDNTPTILDLENSGIPHCASGTADLQYYTSVTNGQMVYGNSSKVLYIYANDAWRRISYENL